MYYDYDNHSTFKLKEMSIPTSNNPERKKEEKRKF